MFFILDNLLSQDIRSFFSVGPKKSTAQSNSLSAPSASKQSRKKAAIISSDEDEPIKKERKVEKTATKPNKRRIVYSDDEEVNTPSSKKPNLSRLAQDKERPKLKVVKDVGDVFGDAPIKRIEKPKTNKTMTEEELNSHFMDDLDVDAIPDVDLNVSQISTTNGEKKEIKKDVESKDDSVIEATPKQNRSKGGSDKRKSTKKVDLDSSNWEI